MSGEFSVRFERLEGGEDTLWIDGERAARLADPVGVEELAAELGVRLVPIGYAHTDRLLLLAAEDGRFFASHDRFRAYLGASLQDLVETIVEGKLRPLPDPDPKPVSLRLTDETRATLLELLAVALELPRAANVLDHLPSEPWGDLEELRRRVYDPLHGEASPGDGHAVHIAAADVEPLRAVLDGIAECYSGGAPWPPLTDAERVAVERLISALSG